MASQSSSRPSTSQNTVSGNQLYCYLNEITPLRVFRFQGPKLGMWLSGCLYHLRTCGLFRWANKVNDENELSFLLLDKEARIVELEHENDVLQMKLKEV
ncbi:Exchange factor for Arf-6 [Bienertia sinuspersici]